jgi:hypothetical protein
MTMRARSGIPSSRVASGQRIPQEQVQTAPVILLSLDSSNAPDCLSVRSHNDWKAWHSRRVSPAPVDYHSDVEIPEHLHSHAIQFRHQQQFLIFSRLKHERSEHALLELMLPGSESSVRK